MAAARGHATKGTAHGDLMQVLQQLRGLRRGKRAQQHGPWGQSLRACGRCGISRFEELQGHIYEIT